MFQKVEICGINTASLQTLTHEETEELLRRVKERDLSAREELITGNLRLVLSVIQRFSRKNASPDDLFQVGCIGLIKAIDHFDLAQNVRFSTYAVPMIIGEVRRYLRDNNMIRVSRSVRDLAYRAMRQKERLSGILCREPTAEEIAAAVNEETAAENDETEQRVCTARQITAALDAVVEPMSLFDPVYSEGGDEVSLMDQLYDVKNTPDVLMEDLALKDAMENLANREREIIRLRYYRGKTQVEVAREIGISQAQVSRLEKSAIQTLRSQM